ncbi:conserved hypothetical protein [Burkholderia sp. H160]|nr:conserved hypothetical protein [Burkholderia sp. H160]
MTNSIRHTAAWLFIAATTYALPGFAQNNAAPAAPDANAVNDFGAGPPAPAGRRAANRNNEQQLLGAPAELGGGTLQGDTDEAQRADLLDEQRMTVTDRDARAQRARDKAQRKTPAIANGQMRVAGQPGPGAGSPIAAGLLQGISKNPYTDPYSADKHPIYRSPW